MKKRILLVAVLQVFLVLNSCSSDSGGSDPVVVEPPVVVVKTAKITSYSKNSGETGETVSIYGENFSDKMSDIKVTFDGVAATVASATASEIKVVLPQTEKVVPKLEVTIVDKAATNEVKNDYEGNIGILPARTVTGWITQENSLKNDGTNANIQMVSDKSLYFSSMKTSDGGITWKRWSEGEVIHATVNNEGWSTGLANPGLTKVSAGGSEITKNFANIESSDVFYCVYVDATLKEGTAVTQNGKVYTTSNGIDFTKTYELSGTKANLFKSTKIDNNHMWVIGYKPTVGTILKPFILYKNNTTDGWKEYPFVNEEAGYIAREICFVDNENGFLIINHYNFALLDVKLFKTNDGGDSWTEIYNNEFFSKFTFKDTNTGWAVLDNKIYKTTNGGAAWTLDYTHSQNIGNIAYKDNVVWAFSEDKIIKRYL